MNQSLLAVSIVFALASTGSAFAQAQGAAQAAVPQVCNNDAQKFCATSQAADRHNCLMTNMTSLTDACKSALNTGGAPATQGGEVEKPAQAPSGAQRPGGY